MGVRELHAFVLPPGDKLADAIGGTLDGGPAVLPLPPDLSAKQLARVIADLRPHAVVTADGAEPVPGGIAVDDDIGLVIRTSGSTGDPKGVELSATALRASARATLDRLEAPVDARWLCCLPLHYIAGAQVVVR